jgi:multidrug transporter EmrE-like cation transporter
MKLVIFPLLLFGVLLNAAAQLLLKAGMEKIGHFNFTLSNVLPIGTQIALNPYVLLGLLCYVVSVAVWLLVLSRLDVSLAYPMVSIGYIINALAAYYLLGESLSWSRMIGIGVILFGVYLVAQS